MLSVEFQPVTASTGQVTSEGIISLVIAGLCLVFGLAFLPFLRRTWRGDHAERLEDILSTFGNRIGQALHCCVVLVTPFFSVAGILLIVDAVRPATSDALRTYLDTAFNVCLTIFGVLLAIFWLLVFFNQPKFLAPPHMRYYNGIIIDLVVTVTRKIFRRQ